MTTAANELLTRLRSIHSNEDTTNFNVVDFLSAFGSPVEALAYSRLFWPDFTQVDKAILRSDVVEDDSDIDRVRSALITSGCSVSKTESSFNRLDIPCGIFGKRSGDSSSALDEQLAGALVEMWRARLQQVYPSRRFVVTSEREDDGEIFISFHQAEEQPK